MVHIKLPLNRIFFAILIVATFILINNSINRAKKTMPEIKVVSADTIHNVIFYNIEFKDHLYEIKIWTDRDLTYTRHNVDCKCYK